MNNTAENKGKLSVEQKRQLLKKALRDKARKVKSNHPLSSGQQALWLLHQQAPESPAYNIALATRIYSTIDVAVLQDVFKTLLTRHPSLRTTFSLKDEQPVQVIHGYQELSFEQIDVANASDEKLNQRVAQMYQRPFDLADGPLMRVNLFSRSNEAHVLLVTIHHIVGDALSIWLLMSEILSLYPALKAGQVAKLPPAKWQYQDFVSWQSKLLDSPQGDKLWHYWQQNLAGDLPVLSLPTDRPRPPVQSYNGASINFNLPTQLMQGLTQLSRSFGATHYVILMATFQVLLHRLSGQDDILVGSPTGGRNRSEFEAIFGYFVNPIVLRAKLTDNPSFMTFLQQVRQTVLDGLAHQDYPFPELVKRLQPRRDVSRSPLFQVLFVMQKLDKDNVASLFLSGDSDESFTAELGSLTLAPFKMAQQEGQFDLSLEMIEAEGSLSGNFRYNTDLFDAQTVQRFVGYFQNLLESIVVNPEQPVSDLTMLTEQEQHQLMVQWNNTKADYPSEQCIHQLIETQVELTPDAIALVCGENRLTYNELNTKANQLAHHLNSRPGVNKGAGQDLLIGLCIERSIDLVIGILAILKAGGAYIPIDPAYPAERLTYMLEDAGMEVLITHSSLKQKLPASSMTTKVLYLDLETEALSKASKTNPESEVAPSDLIYIIYTSGSTGQPKSVAVYHQGFANLINWFVKTFEVTATDLALVVSPSSFDLTQKNIFAPLVKGGQLHLLPQTYYEPELISNIVAQQQISWINCASSAFYPLIEANEPTCFEKLASMRYVFLGGEPISIKTLWPWLQSSNCQVKVVNPYGPSECTDVCAAYITHNPEQFLDKSLPVGKPVDNAEIYILGQHLELLPVGAAGEIHIGGVGVGRGYLNSPQMTKDKFISSPFAAEQRLYKTGDLARYLPDGNIEYLGRIDNQVKVRGFRIELGEIEAAIAQHPQVDKVVAMVRDDKVREDLPSNPRIVAYLIAKDKDDAALKPELLRAFLKAKLPDYMVPSLFVTLEEFPLSANGKTDLRALPSPKSVKTEFSLPQTELQQKIAAIWQQVLDVDAVGIHDNFFDLGGHSLLLVQLQSKLKKAFSQQIAIVELFEHPTIEALALHLGQATQTSPISSRSVSRTDGEVAIIGMSARLPGADDIDSYWQNLKDGVESVTFFSDEQLRSCGVDEQTFNQPNYVNASAVLNDIDAFDAAFFDISPKEAQMTDPQHRLFLECAWQAVENAGYEAGTDEHAIGVFAGAALNTYLINNLSANEELNDMVDIFKVMIGNSNDFLTTRTSYKLNLKGPSINVQTACSTSLVAVNLACDSLQKGDCDIALAGGVSVRVPHKTGYLYQEGMILSPDGHCRAFDAQAKGIVGGNGVGIVVLKRLENAIAEGDNVLAVIKGSATNNDGALKMNFSAPSVAGQANVIAQAQAKAGIAPESISYIEAHGTGTELGDPIEIAALNKVFTKNQKTAVAIGSVKSNIGHTDSAAGVASLIKTVLSLQHQQLPPTLHFEKPNPQIDFADSPFYINNTLTDWSTKEGIPRRAGVSSFGIGGTNAHAIVEEAPVKAASEPSKRPWQLIVLSAKTPTALETATRNLANHVERSLTEHAETNLADVAYTLSNGRKAFNHRRVLICKQLDEIPNALNTLEPTSVFSHAQEHKEQPALTFMFSGQGSQYVNMGVELYQTEPVFKEQVDYCAQYLTPLLGCDLRDVMYVEKPTDDATSQLNQTAITQAALFVTEYALAKLWMSWGVYPESMIGHSIGEYVAACLAQVFSLDDALTLVAARGRLMQSVKGKGAMLAVPLAAKDVQPLLKHGLTIAAINAPAQCVVAGPTVQIQALESQLFDQNIEGRHLATSHAFHSQMMEPILAEFGRCVAQIELSAPKIPYLSNVAGDWISAQEAVDPKYWVKHLRQTVHFSSGIQRLLNNPNRILLEVGPGQSLSVLAKRHQASNVLSSLNHRQDKESAHEHLLKTLGKFWLAGGQVNWSKYYANERRLRLPLPTYPFERQSYWVEGPTKTKSTKAVPATISPSIWPALVKGATLQTEATVSTEPHIDGTSFLQSYEAGLPAIEQLSLAYINLALREIGAFNESDESEGEQQFIAQNLCERFTVESRYHQLVSHWLNLLAEHGHLQRQSGKEQAVFSNLSPMSHEVIDTLLAQARQQWPEVKWVDRLMNFGQNLAAMLKGEKEPLTLSFEGENLDTKVQQDDMPLVSYYNRIISKCVQQVVDDMPATANLKVLEIGAGMGLTTTALLPMLPSDRTQYTFTDVGKFFLRRAQQQLGQQYPFMRFGELNVEQSPQQQGYQSHSFDVIVATMMLHVVKDMKETIQHVRSLLAPGGVLLFLEGTQDLLDFEITDGLLMQTLNDGQRNQGNPFLTKQQWHEALTANGFSEVAAFPEKDTLGYQVFVAQADSSANSDKSDAYTQTSVAATSTSSLPLTPLSATKQYVAPRTAAEKVIAEIWGKALGLDAVSVNDDFFELGGDSLLAIQLVAKLNNTFEVDLSLSQVIDAPTVAKLASFVSQTQDYSVEQSASILVNLQAHGTKPPLFCIHPGGGAVFPFIKLAQYLGDDQPLYAIQSPALVGQQEFTSLAKRALHYIDAIKSVQSEGPYFLTGMSFGGNMAVEMAIQLKKQGDEVGFVGLFDSYPPVSYQTQVDDHQKFLMGFLGIVQIMFKKQFTDISFEKLQSMSEQEQWQYILEQVDDPVTDGMYPKLSQQLFTVWKSQHTELKEHRSQSYSGPITLFQAIEKPPKQLDGLLKTNVDKRFIIDGWNQIAADPIERVMVPGNHFTLLDEPHVQIFADLLTVMVKKAQVSLGSNKDAKGVTSI